VEPFCNQVSEFSDFYTSITAHNANTIDAYLDSHYTKTTALL